MNEKVKEKMSVRDLCYISIFAALIAVLSQVSIPMPGGVPMTLQTLIIPIAGIVLGAKRGTIAAVIYVLLGAVGIPVFAGTQGGLSVIVGATGGFILSFPLMAFIAGKGAERKELGKIRHLANVYLSLVLSSVVNYIFGVVFFMAITSSDIRTALIYCVLPFIPTAIIKILLAGMIGDACKTLLLKAGVME